MVLFNDLFDIDHKEMIVNCELFMRQYSGAMRMRVLIDQQFKTLNLHISIASRAFRSNWVLIWKHKK